MHLDAADRMREVRGLDVVTWPRTGEMRGAGGRSKWAWGGGLGAGGQPLHASPTVKLGMKATIT